MPLSRGHMAREVGRWCGAVNNTLTLATVCLGLHLARDEMLLGTVTFLGAFPNASIPNETTAKSMKMEHYFAVAPKAHRCLIDLGLTA